MCLHDKLSTFFEKRGEKFGGGLADVSLRVVDYELVNELHYFGGSGSRPTFDDGAFSYHQDIYQYYLK
jgi:hypothetical protein